jgi:hypothetical protein
VTDMYAFMLIARAAAGEPGEPTASAVLHVDLQPVVVCLPSVVAIVEIRLGDVRASGADSPVPRSERLA